MPLRVLPLTGNLDGVMPSAVTLDGTSPKLHAVGFGLQPPEERGTANDGLNAPVPVPRGGNGESSQGGGGGGDRLGLAPPVACAVGQMAAEVAERVIEGGGAVLCPSARAPSAGFWVTPWALKPARARVSPRRDPNRDGTPPVVRTISPTPDAAVG